LLPICRIARSMD